MRIVLPARAVSICGDAVAIAALTLAVAKAGEPWQLSLLLAAFGLPIALLAGPAGRIVDAHDSRRLLVGFGLAQAAAAVGLAFASSLPWILGLVFVLQCGQAVTGPTWGALVPEIVGEESVGRAIGLTGSLAAVADLVGMALGGVLFDRAGLTAALLLDAATFVMIAVAALRVRTRRGPAARPAAPLGAPDGASSLEQAPESGLRFVRQDLLLRLLLPAILVFVVTAEATNVVESLLVTRTLGGDGTAYGLVMASFAVGAIVGRSSAIGCQPNARGCSRSCSSSRSRGCSSHGPAWCRACGGCCCRARCAGSQVGCSTPPLGRCSRCGRHSTCAAGCSP